MARAPSAASRMRRAASQGRSAPKMAEPATRTRAPASDHRGGGVLVDAAVDLELGTEAPAVELGARAGDLGQDLGHEAAARRNRGGPSCTG